MISTVEKYMGVMSGSSLDGVDIAEVSFVVDGQNEVKDFYIEKGITIPYTLTWLERLKSYDELSTKDFLRLEAEYSIYISQLINDFASKDVHIEAIGVHGHTLYHYPALLITKQLGNGGIISSLTGIDTVTDFRIQDIAQGGSGAPIAPTLDQALFSEYDYLLNLGGIANITVITEKGGAGYDICPCNQLLNHLAQKVGYDYDAGGEIARKHKVDERLLHELLNHTYHKQDLPKSLDNNWIKDTYLPLFDEAHTGLATAVEYIAYSVAESMKDRGKVMVTGGGAHNSYLIESIQRLLLEKEIELIIPDSELVDYKEVLLMAYMAFCRKYDKVNVFNQYTGAKKSSIAGSYYKANA